MQDIVFYVAANETLGKVRDYSNMRNSAAPLLTLGVAVCLRIRLFEDVEVSTPYPIASFSGITDWKWRMDADFDRSTPCKLVADADGITVHTVTDTINGKIVSFTEVVIPISNMNTRELVAWLGNNKVKTGLVGELVGYDNEGHPAFVLQIEDFSVRNRLAGLNEEDEDDPTPVDQEIVTRPMAEQMIQMAVSASAATKQDKLTSENAGTGISITGAGVISTANVPQSTVTGLSASLNSKQDKLTSENAGTGISVSNNGVISAANIPQSAVTGLDLALDYKQNTLSAGFWTEIDDDWISVERYHMIHGPFSRGTVSMQAGEAYRIYATTSAVTLGVGNIPDNTWGLEGHAEIFVASTGYVVTGSNVVLADPLVPDAVNNCTVRFHDGLAIISVEDHVAGYIVVSGSTSGSGSLYYGITTSTNDYVAFDASLNGTTIPLAGAVAEGEKHVVGNGYAETTLTGAVDCGTSKFTVANLALQDVVVNGGVMTFGDAFIPSGSTVAVSGGGLAVEKVVGAGAESVIDLGGTHLSNTKVVSAAGCTFTNGKNEYGGVIQNLKTASFSDCVFSGNVGSSGTYGTILYEGTSNAHATFISCTEERNTGGYGVFVLQSGGKATFKDCTLKTSGRVVGFLGSATATFSGSNSIPLGVINNVLGSQGSVTLTSGATLDLTGNTNATPIAPGGGITFESGGATVLYDHDSNGSAMASSSSYMMDNVTLPAGAKLTNTSVIDLGRSFFYMSGTVAQADGCVFTNGSANNGGAFRLVSGAECTLNNCLVSGNSAETTGGGISIGGGTMIITGTTVTGNTSGNGAGIFVFDTLVASSSIISGNSGSDIRFTSVGAVASATDCVLGICSVSSGTLTLSGSNTIEIASGKSGTVNITSGATIDLTGNTYATPIAPGGGITFESGGATVKVGDATASSSYMINNVKLPAGAKLTNTAVVNLGGTNVNVSSGTTAAVSGCIITGSTSGGAFTAASNTVLRLDDCVVQNITGATASDAAIQITRGTLYMSGCTVSANTNGTSATGAVNVAQSTGLAYLSNCALSGNTPLDLTVTVGAYTHLTGGNTVDKTTLRYNGHLEIEGSNSIGSVSGSGTVTISSGAILDLTGNTNSTPIAPGGGITLYGGTDSNPTKILFSSGTSSGSRTFERAEIYGSTITNLGLVLGATVTTSNDVEIEYSFDDGATTSSVALASGTFEVPDGAALTKIYLT